MEAGYFTLLDRVVYNNLIYKYHRIFNELWIHGINDLVYFKLKFPFW